MTVEAIVLAKDEEGNIRDCLRSLLWADGLTVFLDPRSSDDTALISASLGARVLEHPFRNFAEQRNAALEVAWGDWVFFFDADERSTPALAEETREAITRSEAGWWVPRDNYIFGRLTRHAGWYPDYQLRLLKRGCASYDLSRPVHETVLLQGEMGYLKSTLVHYNYRSLRQFREKQRHYARLEAEALTRRGVRPRLHSLALQPLREFRRRFVELQGYKDGRHGLLLSILLAYYTLRTYGYLMCDSS